MAEAIFWACLLLILYTYVGYPLLLFCAYTASQIRRDWRYLIRGGDRRRSALRFDELPAVSLIVPVYNEEAGLARKIENLRHLDYPREKLQVLFVSDGSTDRSNEILGAIRDPGVETLYLPVRQGKPTALNQAVARARHPILAFCDAAALLAPDAIRLLVRHFADPGVGVVSGTVKLQGSPEFQQTEGVYWGYETMLRLMEARLGVSLVATGAMYAIRKECYRPLAPDVLVDDLVVPINGRRLGYRAVFDPEAVAIDFAAASVRHQFTRRVRLAVGSFDALGEFLRVPLTPVAWVAFVSHKLLRWVLPFLMLGLLLSNAWLLGEARYRVFFVGQVLFYLWAGVGFLLRDRVQGVRFALVGYFLLAINVAFLVGFARVLAGRDKVAWQRGHS
jgi:cellulose synthase/poly-beta-1,6-N-acetylglucosamine synthase-like glycosyltransferase